MDGAGSPCASHNPRIAAPARTAMSLPSSVRVKASGEARAGGRGGTPHL